ncbi:hypothetical protein [Streptomyces sp. NPDC088789]|uniref:hypothetical protein n=1 Tax=Streptomyces sp. NPDC088789 TaxID=3365899 RepID=UPI00381B9493
MSQMPPPYYPPPPPPRKSRTNAVIIGSAAVLITAIVGTGLAVVNSRDDDGGKADAAVSEPAATPSPSATVSDECRAWVRGELLDGSESMDAESGYAACGDLSDAELGSVIDEVGEEISDDPSALAEATRSEAERFQECVRVEGTAGEKAAVEHVTKVTGAEGGVSEVFTDFSGGVAGPDRGEAKLVASAFGSCYGSEGGLVSVYGEDGDVLATGRY